MPRKLYVRTQRMLKPQPARTLPVPMIEARDDVGPIWSLERIPTLGAMGFFRQLNERAARGSSIWPEGAESIYILDDGMRVPNYHENWDVCAGTIRTQGGLREFFFKTMVPLEGVTARMFPAPFSGCHVVTVATRAPSKCRFPQCEYFRPTWNYLYLSGLYR